MDDEQGKQWAVLSREFSDAQDELTRRFDALFSEEAAALPFMVQPFAPAMHTQAMAESVAFVPAGAAVVSAAPAPAAPYRTAEAVPAPRASRATIDAYFDAWERLQALQDRIRFFYFGEYGASKPHASGRGA